jgi:hypothetical protein
MAQIRKQTTARETQGTKTELTKSATPMKSNKKKSWCPSQSTDLFIRSREVSRFTLESC